jgi:hypothetical protein
MSLINRWLPAGPPIDEEQQIGRRSFIDGLEQRLEDAEKRKLFAGRRAGKTSAARAVLSRFAQRSRPAAAVDLARVQDPVEAAARLAQQLAPGLEELAAAGRMTTWLHATLGDLTETADRVAVIEGALLEFASPGKVLEMCAQGLADEPAAILIDEAHNVAGWDADVVEELRCFLRDDQRLGVVVSSSERHALDELTQPDGPLEYVGQGIILPPIAREDWEAELPKRFTAIGTPINRAGLDRLLDESRCHPFCTMWLARESARLGMVIGRVDDASVEAALHIVQRDEQWELRDGDD